MNDVFENVASKYKNSPSSLVLFLGSLAMLIIGINHFMEDTYSSYLGLISLEKHFNMSVQIFDWTYWTMSIAPQIASIVFFYVYLANTDKKWALLVSLGSQVADFMADLWYRSNGAMFTNWSVTIASALITFSFFTIGSEMFLTFGAGLCLKLAAPAFYSWKYYRNEISKIKKQFSGGGHQPQEHNESGGGREKSNGNHGGGKGSSRRAQLENERNKQVSQIPFGDRREGGGEIRRVNLNESENGGGRQRFE